MIIKTIFYNIHYRGWHYHFFTITQISSLLCLRPARLTYRIKKGKSPFTNGHWLVSKILKNFRLVRMQKFLCFFILSDFLFTVNSKYFFKSWCCILDYFILNYKLWDKFLISMIILILIISYILIFYRNFELILEFMALNMWPKRLSFFLFFRIFISNSDNFNRRK